MKKPIVIFLALALCALIAIVLSRPDTQHPDSRTIAIVTLMSHPSLDAVQENTINELKESGYIEGENTKYVFKNANGQVQLAATIANELSVIEPDVVVAITTPMAQAVVKVADCPVVFAAVTDPVGAGLVDSLDSPTPNITGTSDAWPYEAQLKLIRRISPDATRIGVLYNPGEAASQYGISQIRKYAPDLGFELIEGPVSSTSEVFPVAQSLVDRVDVLFLSSDNTVIGGVSAAVKVAIDTKTPLYVGDSGTVELGGIAAVSVGYAELGVETGRLVTRILAGETEIPTVVATGVDISVNVKAAELMGVTIPDDVLAEAATTFSEIKE